MGMDAYAVAAWGLQATYGEIRKTFVQSRTWIGTPTGDHSHDFDPTTGRPNYETQAECPQELKRWHFHAIDGSNVVEKDTKCVIVLSEVRTLSHRSHRSRISIEKIPAQPDARELSVFKDDMKKIGLWQDDHFGLWLFLDVSC